MSVSSLAHMEKEVEPSLRDENEGIRMRLKQIVKKARAFEVRRLLRRAKLVQHKKGSDDQLAKNQRKAERIVGDVQRLRTFTTDELTNTIYEIVINAREDNKSLEEYLSSDGSGEPTNDQVILSLITSKLVYSQLSKVVASCSIGEAFVPKKQLPRSPSAPRKGFRASDKAERKVRRKTDSIVNNVSESVGVCKAEAPIKELTSPSNDDSSEFEEDDFFLRNSDDDRLLVKRQKVNSPENKQSLQGKRKAGCDPVNEYDKNAKLRSTFLGSMNSSEDFSDRKLQLSSKKNRMGQRARQKLWSVKYGNSAKQSVNTTGIKYRKLQKAKGTGEDFVNKKNIAREGTLNKVEKTKGFENLAFDSHPSWEAKRKEKASQQIQEFKGTKITFDDD